MKLKEIFRTELQNPETDYFVLDSGQHENDVDFEAYEWRRSINNKLSAGDLFLYRRPRSQSGMNKFLIFGIGKIGSVVGDDAVVAEITKAHPFPNPIFQRALENYEWAWKERGETWEHFWNQYGINQIPKEDFLNLLDMAEGDYDPGVDKETVAEDAEIAQGDYSVEDSKALTTSRPWQAAWSNRVKSAYGYTCAVCGISSPEFLIGSHIIPVGDKEYRHTRKDPSNGICLCALHDRAFDGGYITVNDDLTIQVSERARSDEALWGYIGPMAGTKMRKPTRYFPKPDYLAYHRNKKFLR